jgi:N-succinyldiaminopimelate aminotransferase
VPGGVTGKDEVQFARQLLAQYNVQVLPGRLLARDAPASTNSTTTSNPGQGRVRMALVAPVAECLEAAQRIVRFCQQLPP